MFSARSRAESSANPVARAIAAAREARRPLVELTGSNPTVLGLPYEQDEILRALASERALIYEPDAFGLATAREAVSSLWRDRGFDDVGTDRIVMTASTSEAYAYLFKLLCDPGDTILIPRPSYPLFEHIAALESVRLRTYRLGYDGAWHLDMDSVRRAVDETTRAIIVVSPNNPTGSYLKRAELEALGALRLPIISDEVFDDYALCEDSCRARSALEASDNLVFALDGISKRAGLPQLKLAFIAVGGPTPSVREALRRLEVIADTFLSANAVAQHALPALLRHTESTRVAIRERLGTNLGSLNELTAGSAVTPLRVEGGWSAVVRLPALEDEDSWILGLLRDRSVVAHPGWFYDFEAGTHAVVSLLTPEATFEEGIRRLVSYADVLAG